MKLLVALRAKGVDLVEHPLEKNLGRRRGNAGALKAQDLLPLPANLHTHALDFTPDVVDVPALPPSPNRGIP